MIQDCGAIFIASLSEVLDPMFTLDWLFCRRLEPRWAKEGIKAETPNRGKDEEDQLDAMS